MLCYVLSAILFYIGQNLFNRPKRLLACKCESQVRLLEIIIPRSFSCTRSNFLGPKKQPQMIGLFLCVIDKIFHLKALNWILLSTKKVFSKLVVVVQSVIDKRGMNLFFSIFIVESKLNTLWQNTWQIINKRTIEVGLWAPQRDSRWGWGPLLGTTVQNAQALIPHYCLLTERKVSLCL